MPDVFLLDSVGVEYVIGSRGDVAQLEQHCSRCSLVPKPTSHLSGWTVSTSAIHWNLESNITKIVLHKLRKSV